MSDRFSYFQNTSNDSEAQQVLMIESDGIIDLELKYWKRFKNKIKNSPEPLQLLQKRTYNTAVNVIQLIHDIPFDKLSMSLYFYCQDVQMIELTRLYESQIELAGANPERFIFELHKFYNQLAQRIRREDLYNDLFELYYRCSRLRLENQGKNISDSVMTAYLCLILQHTEYIRPNKFDFTTFVVGRKTTGEIMTVKEPFYNIDYANYEIRDKIVKAKSILVDDIKAAYAKYGYQINNLFDIDLLMNKSRIFTSSSNAMLPFINEYTFDILPTTMFSGNMVAFEELETVVNKDDIKNDLLRRNETLPANGVYIEFSGSNVLKGLLLKEILYDNSIFMLYKLITNEGDIPGFYDTKDKLLYTIFFTYQNNPAIEYATSSLILYCYASYTVKDPKYSITKVKEYFITLPFEPLIAEGYLKGGKLQNVYESNTQKSNRKHLQAGKRIGNEAYEAEEKYIQGYIRKLPEGKRASREAIELAESLGYFLDSDHTYVRPFSKQVFKLKEK